MKTSILSLLICRLLINWDSIDVLMTCRLYYIGILDQYCRCFDCNMTVTLNISGGSVN